MENFFLNRPTYIICIVIFSILVSCNRAGQPSLKDIERIEDLTMESIAYYEFILDETSTIANSMQEFLDESFITERGLVGSGTDPAELHARYNSLSIMIDGQENLGDLFDEEYIATHFQKGSTEYELVMLLNKQKENVNVALSKFEPIEVAGKTKMWKYSELISGHEYIATLDKDNTVMIKISQDEDLYDSAMQYAENEEKIEKLYKQYLRKLYGQSSY